MRVLIVHPHLSAAGGAARVVRRLAQGLDRRGIETSLLTLTPLEGVEEDFSFTSDLYFPSSSGYSARPGSGGLGETKRLLREITTLASMLRRHAKDFDVVNIYNFPSTWAVYGLGKPVVWMFNEPGDIRENLRRSLFLRSVYGLGVRMDRHMVNSHIHTICVGDESNRDRVMRRYGREPRLVPYGMEVGSLPEGRDSEMRRRLGIEGRFVLLQPGMVSPQKNQLESLRVLKVLKKRIRNVVLVFAGLSTGAYRKRLDEYIRRNGLENDVIFTGHVREKEALALYGASDVALFPEKAETGWLYPLEVFSSGATLVVSEAFGSASFIAREGLGLVTNDMASAIEDIFRNPGKGRQVAARAFEWVDRNFGWDNFTGSMVDVFESAVA